MILADTPSRSFRSNRLRSIQSLYQDLNNTDFLGRDMKVNEAQENNRPSSKSRTARPIDHLRYVMSYPLPDGGNVSDLLRGDQRFQEIKNMLDR